MTAEAQSDGNAQCRMKTRAGWILAAEIHFDRIWGKTGQFGRK